MNRFTRRSVSLALVLVLLLSTMVPVAFAAQKNTGTRHQLCTSLSSQAVTYYTGDYSPEVLISYATDTTGSCLKAVDSELYEVLQTLMTETHTHYVLYNNNTNGLQTYWPYTDCNNGSGKVQLFYSDTTGSFNREHVWPKSRASFYQSEGGSDLHHLRPTDTDVNSKRSNYTFANVQEMVADPTTKTHGGKTVLWYDGSYTENGPQEKQDNLGLVEVNDNIKGDVARILLYVYTRWEEKNLFENDPNAKPGSSSDENNGLRVIFDLETLLEWCEMDPVDTWEMGRNDATQAVQGNRNVFIDYPELAWLLFGQEPPADMQVPEKLPLTTTAYTITAVSNNTQWGTVAQSGRRITATPNTGYYIEGYTVLSGQATVKRTDEKFIVTPESDCTIQINFAPKAPATASFNMGASAISSYVGETVTLPTGTPPNGYRFVGWVLNEIEDTTMKPAYYEAGSSYTLSGNVTFLGLCSYSDGVGSGNWVLVTEEDSLRSGIRVVLASVEGGAVAAALNGKYLTDTDATFAQDGGVIDYLPDDAVIFTLGGTENAWTLAGEDGKLLGAVGQKNVGWDSGSMEWKITINDGKATMYSGNESYGRILYNRSSPRFTTYTNAVSSTLVLPQIYTNDGGVVHYTTDVLSCNHSYEAVVTEPTCYENGYTMYTCILCGYSYVSEQVQAGHDYIAVVTEPTCAGGGFTTYTCSMCAHTYTADSTQALDHVWDEGVITLEPTETEMGEIVYTCSGCEATRTIKIPATGKPDDGGGNDPIDFADVQTNAYYYDPVMWAVENGITNGINNTKFGPDATCTRGQIVTFLWRAAGSPEPTKMVNPFEDIKQGDYYFKAVIWAVEKGITTGVSKDRFNPEGGCTRGQVVTFLWRSMGAPETEGANPFKDVTEDAYYYDAVLWALDSGITTGTSNNAFGPDKVCTRAQIVTFIYRANGHPEVSELARKRAAFNYTRDWLIRLAEIAGLDSYSYPVKFESGALFGITYEPGEDYLRLLYTQEGISGWLIIPSDFAEPYYFGFVYSNGSYSFAGEADIYPAQYKNNDAVKFSKHDIPVAVLTESEEMAGILLTMILSCATSVFENGGYSVADFGFINFE